MHNRNRLSIPEHLIGKTVYQMMDDLDLVEADDWYYEREYEFKYTHMTETILVSVDFNNNLVFDLYTENSNYYNNYLVYREIEEREFSANEEVIIHHYADKQMKIKYPERYI